MPHIAVRFREFADGLLDDLDFMMTSRDVTVRALRIAFFIALAWLALSLAVLFARCSA